MMTMDTYRNPKLERLIARYPSQSKINLSYQQITDQDLNIITRQAILNKKCRELCLYSNEITADGVSILASAIKTNTTLEKLLLWDNPLGDEGLRYLTDALLDGTSALKDLRIGWTNITDVGASHLAELLKVTSIFTDVWARENKIGDKGVSLLMDALAYHNTSLQILWLRGNTLITDECIDSVINMLKHNQTLRQLSLELCSVSDLGKEKLEAEVAEKTNFSLWV